MAKRPTKYELAKDWLRRYTNMPLDGFGDFILLTNFAKYAERFAEQFGCDLTSGAPMQVATNGDGLTIVNFGIGSPNAALIMDLLIARRPKGVLFLGKCGGLKKSAEIGRFILPIGAIRGEGTSDDYMPPEVPALPSFKLHKFVSQKLHADKDARDYRTGVVFTTNRRLWEHDEEFLARLRNAGAIAIDMETATIFICGHKNQIARGALLLVSDFPITPDGVKSSESDRQVTKKWVDLHIRLGIESMTDIAKHGEEMRHFRY